MKALQIISILIALGLGVAAMHYDWHLFEVTTSQCKNAYCRDYNFLCCGEDILNPETKNAESAYGDGYAVLCPGYASRCEILSMPVGYSYHIYLSCEKKSQLIPGFYYWSCSGDMGTVSQGSRVEANQWVAASTSVPSFSIRIYATKLFDCGKAACTYSGIPKTTSGCVWVTNERIYDSNGNVVGNPVAGQDFQYTVPKGVCYLYPTNRYVCGDSCESCSADSDCAVGHSFVYNGKGAECVASQLQLYGCRKGTEICLEQDKLPFITKCSDTMSTPSRCDLIESRPVECCPQTSSCGPNAFCDPITFTCKNTAQCTYDWECGQATACDFSTKTLKKPVCQAGQCASQVLQTVECCYDVNCPTGYFCDSDYKCKQQVCQKSTCPFECCERENTGGPNNCGYFDKPCPEGQSCVDHKCSGGGGGIDLEMWAIIFAIIVGALAFFMSGGVKNYKEEEYDSLAISAIFAIVAGLIAWYVVLNWQTILLSLGILAILGGLAIWFFPVAILFFIWFVSKAIKTAKGD